MAVSSGESQANINALIGEGYTQQQISSFNYGSKLNPNEAQAFRSQFGAPAPSVGQQVQTGIANLGSNQYQFDPNQYLPAIQGQADSIYSPQQAQLEAIRQLQQVSAQDTRVQTEKDFAKRMQQEVESINRRGSFFSERAGYPFLSGLGSLTARPTIQCCSVWKLRSTGSVSCREDSIRAG